MDRSASYFTNASNQRILAHLRALWPHRRQWNWTLPSSFFVDLSKQLTKAGTRDRTRVEDIDLFYDYATLGQLTSSILHDMANPLTVVLLSLEELQTQTTIPSVEQALGGAKRMQSYLDLAKQQLHHRPRKIRFNVKEELAQALDLLSYRAGKKGVTIKTSCKDSPSLSGDPIRFQQVIANLVSNAIDAYDNISTSPKTVDVSLSVEGINLVIRITDRGSGIASGNLERIFQPFFTTKQTCQGTGIGLTITRQIVCREYGGRITVTSQQGKGTIFTTVIPLNANRGRQSTPVIRKKSAI